MVRFPFLHHRPKKPRDSRPIRKANQLVLESGHFTAKSGSVNCLLLLNQSTLVCVMVIQRMGVEAGELTTATLTGESA